MELKGLFTYLMLIMRIDRLDVLHSTMVKNQGLDLPIQKWFSTE